MSFTLYIKEVTLKHPETVPSSPLKKNNTFLSEVQQLLKHGVKKEGIEEAHQYA